MGAYGRLALEISSLHSAGRPSALKYPVRTGGELTKFGGFREELLDRHGLLVNHERSDWVDGGRTDGALHAAHYWANGLLISYWCLTDGRRVISRRVAADGWSTTEISSFHSAGGPTTFKSPVRYIYIYIYL